MKKIPLTQGKFTCVDDCDYDYLMQWKWCYSHGYTLRTNPANRKVYMHCVILERMGFKDFARSDHISRDRLDNRRCNLRPATANQSNCNRGIQKNNTSGYIGVSWCQGKWRTRIGVDGKIIYLGLFSGIKEAASVYNKAALKYHGEFAVLNKVD